MKSKIQYCTLTFYIKGKNPLIDSAAKIISFNKKYTIVESKFWYINKDLIDSISITMIECTNMQLAMNAPVESVKKIGNVAQYKLRNRTEKEVNFEGKTFSVYNQSIMKKLNIARINE